MNLVREFSSPPGNSGIFVKLRQILFPFVIFDPLIYPADIVKFKLCFSDSTFLNSDLSDFVCLNRQNFFPFLCSFPNSLQEIRSKIVNIIPIILVQFRRFFLNYCQLVYMDVFYIYILPI